MQPSGKGLLCGHKYQPPYQDKSEAPKVQVCQASTGEVKHCCNTAPGVLLTVCQSNLRVKKRVKKRLCSGGTCLLYEAAG